MNLFYMPGASSLAVHIVLRWLGVPHQTFRLTRNDLHSPWYLALNPAGTVPLLEHEELLLPQTAAILGYLADLHPDHALLGDGTPRSRAEVMRWLSFLNSDVHKAFRPIFYPGRFLRDPAQAAALAEAGRAHVRSLLELLEVQLQDRDWLTGTRTIADAYLFVMMRWATGTKVSLQGLERLSRLMRRLHADADIHAALVIEEGLSARTEIPIPHRPFPTPLSLGTGAETLHFVAEVTGPVEYREGEGVRLELRRGLVEVDLSATDAIISWTDENYRGRAALPTGDLYRYAEEGAISWVG